MSLTGKYVRLQLDQSDSEAVLDVLSGKPPELWRGGVAKVQCAMFTGEPSSSTFQTDISGILSVELVVRKVSPTGEVVWDKVVPAGAGLVASTWAAWSGGHGQGTGWQFQFVISDLETGLPVPDGGSLPLFFAVSAATAAGDFVLGQGYAELTDVGILGVIAPPALSSFYPLSPSAAGSFIATTLRGQADVVVAPVAGSYVYTIVLPITPDLLPGATTEVEFNMPQGIGPTVNVRNATAAGTLLYFASANLDFANNVRATFKFDGTVWFLFGPGMS